MLRSADGGASWQQAGPDWTTRVLNDIACIAALTCYLAGSHGTIARITNGTTVAARAHAKMFDGVEWPPRQGR